jgi:hypothetical protein
MGRFRRELRSWCTSRVDGMNCCNISRNTDFIIARRRIAITYIRVIYTVNARYPGVLMDNSFSS